MVNEGSGGSASWSSLPPPNAGQRVAPVAPAVAPIGESRPLAGFWIRLAALVLDSFLYSLLGLAFAAVGVAVFLARQCYVVDETFECYEDIREPWSLIVMVVLIAIGIIVPTLLYLIALGRSGKTWGNRICGIRVVRADGTGSIGFWRALGRTLFANIFSSAIIYLGYLWMLWDDHNQTWQDMVVKSVVVTDRS